MNWWKEKIRSKCVKLKVGDRCPYGGQASFEDSLGMEKMVGCVVCSGCENHYDRGFSSEGRVIVFCKGNLK